MNLGILLLLNSRSESEICSVVSDSLWIHGNTVHGILQARILEWVAFSFSRGSSKPRDWTQAFRIAGRLFTNWATRKTPNPIFSAIKLKILKCSKKEKNCNYSYIFKYRKSEENRLIEFVNLANHQWRDEY